MVAIAQLVEHLIVVQKVARSSRVSHPGETSEEIPRFFAIRGGLKRAEPDFPDRQATPQQKERTMLSFENDYSCAATPEIIARHRTKPRPNQYPGYGTDDVCESAKAKIREACACPDAEIFFLVGGTQTNQVVIDAITPPYAGVVAATTGHVNVHEAGAIEFTGHKVLTLPHHDGKIDADELDEYCATFYADGNYTHMVFPGCVYISQATEYGTLYTLAELEAIRKICTKYDMPLFIDGARLGYALTASGNDVTIEDIARHRRRVLYRRHQGGRDVRRGRGVHARQHAEAFRDARQAAWRAAGQGMAAGTCSSTRCSPTACTCSIARHANDAADRIREGAGGTWLHADFRCADQPDLRHARQRDLRTSATRACASASRKRRTTRIP